MDRVRQLLEALEVQEQKQLLVELVAGSPPEVQLSLLLPTVTAAARLVVVPLRRHLSFGAVSH